MRQRMVMTEPNQTEPWQMTATAIAEAVRSRRLSATEAVQSALHRLDRVNPTLNAVVEVRHEQALAEAAAIDAAVARGDAGPMAGVPITVKINADMAGHATTNGLFAQQHLLATADSPVIANLRRAGAIVIGRTNAPAFSIRWFTNNALHGATRNPHDPRLTPGGSSGGAASAVASGIGALAHGTDIGGSVRYPAYACGLHGLRPSLGRVPAWNSSLPERGIGPQLMAVSGPLARSVADVRLAFHAMAAPDARDPWYVPAPLEGPPVPDRVALCRNPGGMATVPEVDAALTAAAQRLRAAGYDVTEVTDTPPWQEATDLQVTLWLGEGYPALLAAAEREGDVGALTVIRHFGPMATALPQDAIARALVARATITRRWTMFLDQHPVLLVPSSGELPFADDLDVTDFARVWAAQLTQTALPLMGLPGLAVATGRHGRTPVGVQLIGARYREDLLLAAGAAIEAGGAPIEPVFDPS